ncbi:MAG: DMT family transporter [Paracoccaceae bacterium]|nr:DMT family transporter [Paracoccaceae bacterium]
MTRHPLFGLGLAILGALILTPDTLLMRWAEMNGFQMLAWRGLLSGSVYLSLWAVSRRGKLITDITNLKSPFGAGLIVCQFFNATLFSLGVSIAPVSLVLFGIATVPVFSALFAFLIMREATGPATWVAIFTVLTGIALALFSGENGQYKIEFWSFLGALAGLGVALSLALSFVLIRQKKNSPFVLAIGIGGLLSGTIGFLVTGAENMTTGNIEYIIITGAMIVPTSFFLLSFAARHTHASNVSLALLLETVLGPVWVWSGTTEQPTKMMLIGGFVVVASLITYLFYIKRQT